MLFLTNARLKVHVLDPVADRARLGTRYCTAGFMFQVEDLERGSVPLLSGPTYPDAYNLFDGQGIPDAFQPALGADRGGTALGIGVGLIDAKANTVLRDRGLAHRAPEGVAGVLDPPVVRGLGVRPAPDADPDGKDDPRRDPARERREAPRAVPMVPAPVLAREPDRRMLPLQRARDRARRLRLRAAGRRLPSHEGRRPRTAAASSGWAPRPTVPSRSCSGTRCSGSWPRGRTTRRRSCRCGATRARSRSSRTSSGWRAPAPRCAGRSRTRCEPGRRGGLTRAGRPGQNVVTA